MKSTRFVAGAFVLACSAAALFACAAEHNAFDEAGPEAGPMPVLPEAGAAIPDAAPPIDAADEYGIPDGAVVCDATPCIVALRGAEGTYCALRADGTLACWGSNSSGQLGYDAGSDSVFNPSSATPEAVPGLTGVASFDVGDGNTCARTTDGGVWCWGDPGLVGAGVVPVDGGPSFDQPILEPTRQTAVPAAQTIAVGTHTACITTPSGGLTCWGKNAELELGRGATVDPFAAPLPASVGAQPIAVASLADSRSFAVTASGRTVSWGASTIGGSAGFLLGRDTSEDPDGVPDLVADLLQVRSLSSGAMHGCAVAGRFVDCWGGNDQGQLGRGTFDGLAWLPGASRLGFTVEAEDVDGGATTTHDVALQVAAGGFTTCAVMGSGRVYCWGDGALGQLGPDVGTDKSGYPTRIRGLDGPAVAVAVADGSVCVLLRAGSVECWGSNFSGELANGSTDSQSHPHPQPVRFSP